MDHFPRSLQQPAIQAITFAPPNQPPPDGARFLIDTSQDPDRTDTNIAFMKGPKRKRLAKACDACHKSKRRCDGTAPCSNCYFASKKCTYTDASGRPVPAPRPRKGNNTNVPPDPRQGSCATYPDGAQGNQPSFVVHALQQDEALGTQVDPDEDVLPRKRFRPDLGQSASPIETSLRGLAPPSLPTTQRSLERDPSLTRELVHLFFADRQPQRMIIHEPSFHHALSHGLVPPHLLLSVCALAAPLSQRPCFKERGSRFAGEVFFQEAMSLMFDKDQNLICERNLATAQALCLLQLHDRMAKSSWRGNYHVYALEVIEQLGVYKADNPILTPTPSLEFIDASIERECARRIFWLIYICDTMGSVLYQRPMLADEAQLKLRLPVDETTFLFTVHDAVPEYLDNPSSSSRSETGQLIRVLSIHEKIERTMDVFNERESGRHPVTVNTLLDLDAKLNAWDGSLPDSLCFTDENLAIQMSLFATSSNVGAWCFCAMHIIHCSCVFALNQARKRCRTGMPGGPTWAHERLNKIIAALGGRAKKTIILAIAIWPLSKYCQDNSPRFLELSSAVEEVFGVRIHDLATPAPDYTDDVQPAEDMLPVVSSSGGSHGSTPVSSNSLEIVTPQIAASPVYAPPGRPPPDARFFGQPSFGDVRAHAHPPLPPQPDPREKRNIPHDANIDPALQMPPNPRHMITEPVPAVSPALSLPSLKSSGLLDWQRANEGIPSPSSASWQASGQHIPAPSQSSRDATGSTFPSASHVDYSTRSAVATASTSMPVGLPWLASESTVSRSS
ncbi:fungal-specific transcription factor domain-containing protein [Suillus bovinus]|uniref:fungal-specific transcription factor domain-containing protein n=1 Tax=Suillus bovinus TaxID=48563 RepID=UPI001B86D559|nr:fungal-specific transcription factor domain-containing protein [Suillus bovinus]KAG2157841.1 fungal-specific transcription factor domain-containing protein [Suillus bovinus]